MKVKEFSWEEAPTWARYRAIDADGTAIYFKYKPTRSGNGWVCDRCIGSGWEEAGKLFAWRESLEERPFELEIGKFYFTKGRQTVYIFAKDCQYFFGVVVGSRNTYKFLHVGECIDSISLDITKEID